MTLSWSATGRRAYRVKLGSTRGGSDYGYFDAIPVGSSSLWLNLPTVSSPANLYATLETDIGTEWIGNTSVYRVGITPSWGKPLLLNSAPPEDGPVAPLDEVAWLYNDDKEKTCDFCIALCQPWQSYCACGGVGGNVSSCQITSDSAVSARLLSSAASRFTVEFRAPRTVWPGLKVMSCRYYDDNLPLNGLVGVYDAPPVIGQVTQNGSDVVITGQFFGSRGVLKLCPQGGGDNSPCSTAGIAVMTPADWADGQIRATLNPGGVAPGDYDVEVTVEQGVAGSSFVPQGGNAQSKKARQGRVRIEQAPAAPVIASIDPAAIPIGNTTEITISGTGFGGREWISGIAGQDMTFEIVAASDISIRARVTVSVNASGGNSSVVVTANGQASNAKPLKRQVPTRLVRYDYPPKAPNGVGNLIEPRDEPVVDLTGRVIDEHRCGVYRNYAFQLVDQDGTPFPASYTLKEYFTDYIGPMSNPPDRDFDFLPGVIVSDLQYIGRRFPSCLGPDEHEQFLQRFKVIISGTEIILSTVLRIKRGYYNGQATVDSVEVQ